MHEIQKLLKELTEVDVQTGPDGCITFSTNDVAETISQILRHPSMDDRIKRLEVANAFSEATSNNLGDDNHIVTDQTEFVFEIQYETEMIDEGGELQKALEAIEDNVIRTIDGKLAFTSINPAKTRRQVIEECEDNTLTGKFLHAFGTSVESEFRSHKMKRNVTLTVFPRILWNGSKRTLDVI